MLKALIIRFKYWLKFRNCPCYLGNGEFDHDLEYVDNSVDTEFGVNINHYMQCVLCGASSDEDENVSKPHEYYVDTGEI